MPVYHERKLQSLKHRRRAGVSLLQALRIVKRLVLLRGGKVKGVHRLHCVIEDAVWLALLVNHVSLFP